MPGNLELYLDDMIPGYRDRSKQAHGHANESANDISNSSTSSESDLEQSRFGAQAANIKKEPIDASDESSVDADARTEGPESSNVRNEMNQRSEIQQIEVQTIVIAQYSGMIDKLKEELRAKNEELEASKEQLRQKNEELAARERLSREVHGQLITKLKDAKSRLWCTECNEMLDESPTQLCQVCSLFQ